jgi:hypothetical protein
VEETGYLFSGAYAAADDRLKVLLVIFLYGGSFLLEQHILYPPCPS